MTLSPEATPSSAFRTSPSLLVRVQANEAEAWTRLVDLYGPLVYHWCRKAGLGAEDAADVFQETFRAVARTIQAFRRDRAGDTFRGWLRTVAQNKIRDHFRRLADEPRAEGGTDAQMRFSAQPDPIAGDDDASEDNLLRSGLVRSLESIRGEFEPRTWQAFWLVQVEGKTTAEVGTDLAMTAAAVRKARLRVLARLREELGDLMDL
ncbi:MAG: sigma-70 family RNA polymerase sigma factor [Gemmataceae bacterium]|nr:sigma-70 family RNA polymerase sigma factor [Gemmataceae bacterium]